MRILLVLVLVGLLTSLAVGEVYFDYFPIVQNVDSGSSVAISSSDFSPISGTVRRMWFVAPDLTGSGTTCTVSLRTEEGLLLWELVEAAEATTTGLDFLTTGVLVSGVMSFRITESVGQATSPTFGVYWLREK